MKIEISEDEYQTLKRSATKLHALEVGGVDNWDFYGEAMEKVFEEEEKERAIDSLLDDLECALLIGAYEPAGRGCGFSSSDDGRRAALKILTSFIGELK